ncbi:M23 family metallopeptidase [Glycomyces albidus]|uniref:Peptidoglycan DD-metalloendopeptidase family protein n=1 Tax=Glycomyces albidus TaxID=2656774 RepID=A0A6L5GA05_9ACTN|nr:M23 family metallopeptidase [Glycomyces albidus]MQM26431.1 peptidoglycan DD-metalloendopeptidase family protein [Glycomyces albidus]
MSGGLAAAIITGWIVSALSGQAAAQAADAEVDMEATVVQDEWKVDDVLSDMAAEYAAEQAAAAAAQAAAEAQAKAEAEAAARAEAEAAAKAEAEAEAAAEAQAAAEAEAAAAAEAAKNPWTVPSTAAITSYYGMRNGSMHGGTDFGNNEGDEIVSVGAGTVTYVGFEAGGYGNVVYVDHGDGVETRYAHASEVLVDVGDEVGKGETLILAGTTGNSTGPHLHFEVLIDGEKVDSLAWLEDQGLEVS